MPIRPLLGSLLTIALLAGSARAQEEAAPDAGDLQDNTRYQVALRALQDDLPDIASLRLNEFLATLDADDARRPTVLLRLAEALVRSGDPDKALEILSDPGLQGDDEAIFWTAAAQVAAGRLKDATDTLAALAESTDASLQSLATIGRARLLASLGNLAEAGDLLETLENSDDREISEEARLLRASLLYEEGKADEARALLQGLEPTAPTRQRRKTYLLARLALGAEDHAEARRLFEQLTSDPTHISPALYRSAILGAGDALHALGQDAAAMELLFDYLEGQPQSEFLEPFFARLTSWSAAQGNLRTLLESRLTIWSEIEPPTQPGLLRGMDEATARAFSQGSAVPRTNLAASALYHRALLLAGRNDPDSVAKASSLLNRLRLEFPGHPLTGPSLLETGRLFLARKNPEQALAALEALIAIAGSPAIKSTAEELIGRVEFSQGDFAEAAGAFARARANLQTDDRHVTAINHGLSLLEADEDTKFGELLASLNDADARRTLLLEQALLLAARRAPEAASLLDSFLRQYPNAPRLLEARLALAEVCVFVEPHDLAMAVAQLDSVDANKLPAPFALRHLLAALRLAQLTDQWDGAIAEANTYLRTHDGPLEAEVLLKLGEAYYLNGLYNQAYRQFLQSAKQEPDPALQETARFYAAKAALRVGTEAARTDALALFAEVMETGSLLATDARLQLARTLLDGARPEEALAALEPLAKDPAAGQPYIDALLLTAEAYRIRGGPSDLEECLAVYDRLLAIDGLSVLLNNRIHFHQGMTLEELRQPAKALDAYYSVVLGSNLPEGATLNEWKWYYDCGFRALRLLEDGKRWRSAFRVAQTLAETGGPRAPEAAKRANALQLDHMIWSDEQSLPSDLPGLRP